MRAKQTSLRNWLKYILRHANTWLIIAWLALIGWTLDALRLFLGMHETPWAGLGAFANHFWYVVPIVLAITVLTRLRPRAELLSLAVYDATGQMVHRQGDFYPDDMILTSLRSTLPARNHEGLRGLKLSSGASIYFVHHGGFTIMLCFSGPASPRELAHRIQQLGIDMPAADLLAGLAPSVAALAISLLASPAKRRVLSFLREHDHLAVGLDDLAYRIKQDQQHVAHALAELIDQGLVHAWSACGLTFYQLSRNPELVAQLDKAFAWREAWQRHVQQVERMIG